MKRIVFATVGSLGDVHPYMAVSKVLLARGHHPVIATTDRYRTLIEAEGIGYARLRPDESQFGGLEAVAARLFDPYRGPGYLIRDFVMAHIREQYEDIAAACRGADLLVTHPLTMAGSLASAKAGLPWASSILAPASLISATDRPLILDVWWARAVRSWGPTAFGLVHRAVRAVAWRWERPLHALRADLGLPKAAHPALLEGQFSPRLNLALFPEPLAQRQADWPANTVVAGLPRYDGRPADPALLERMEAFLAAGEPPLVFALGSSVVMLAGDFWDHAIAASRRLGRRAILLTGTPPAMPLPDGVAAFDYLPYSAVFPKAAAIVHQAGIGTLAQALAAGRPQLIVPLAYDQPDNARRAVDLGVGRSLPLRKASAGRLADELAALLREPAYAARAKAVAPGVDDGANRAADALLGAISGC